MANEKLSLMFADYLRRRVSPGLLPGMSAEEFENPGAITIHRANYDDDIRENRQRDRYEPGPLR